MKINILTLFPKMFDGPFGESIVKRAQDKNKSVDDKPYGGGAGMVIRVDIIDKAIEGKIGKIILLDAGGERFTQKKAQELAKEESLIIICGHYEGIDHRVHEYIADEVISIGDYVLSGGEIPAMVIVDSVVRLLPGALGNSESLAEESKTGSVKAEYPQYTRPEEYKGWKVPEVLLSGDHKKI